MLDTLKIILERHLWMQVIVLKEFPLIHLDAVYKLSFGIMLLATDLHNPRVKTKLTFPGWVKMINTDLKVAYFCIQRFIFKDGYE